MSMPVRADEANQPPTDPAQRVEWLIAKVKSLADSGRIDDPDFVAKSLGTTFTKTEKPYEYQFDQCAAGKLASKYLNTEFQPAPDFWYHMQADGTHEKIPAFTINRAFTTGDPALSYSSRDIETCNVTSVIVQHETEASIAFRETPGFVCISATDLKRYLPEATYHMATDGGASFDYVGKEDDAAGTRIGFAYNAGATCVLDIGITKQSRDGYKERRAWIKLEKCRVQKLRPMCDAEGNPNNDLGIINGRVTRADQECGSLQSFIDKEPNSGDKPEAYDDFEVTDAERCRPHTR